MGVTAAQMPEEGSAATSPVRRVSREKIKPAVQLMLYAQSGGFCQFDGCENSIIEHHVTKASENAGEKAHIVAYSDGGTRADSTLPTEYVNSLENLMALCPGCHDHIDKNGERYSRHTLEEMKRARVALVRDAIRNRTGELKTNVLVFEAPIGERIVSIAAHETASAIRPRYPASGNPLRINLNGLAKQGETRAFYDAAEEQIEKEIAEYFRNGGPLFEAQHISLFGIGPIPLLVKLGATLNDKIPTEIHNKRNNPATWDWNADGEVVRFDFRCIRRGAPDGPVVLALSISGAVPVSELGRGFERASVYELHVDGQPPARTLIQTKADLEAFKAAYCSVLGEIAGAHSVAAPVHLLPAVPACIAVACGLMRHPKAHGPLRVYDLRDGAYQFILEIKQ